MNPVMKIGNGNQLCKFKAKKNGDFYSNKSENIINNMRINSSIAMLAAVTVASEQSWSDQPDYNSFLGSQGAYEPTFAQPYSNDFGAKKERLAREYPEEVLRVNDKVEQFAGRQGGVRGDKK